MSKKASICERLKNAESTLNDISVYAPKPISEVGIYDQGDLLGILYEIRKTVADTRQQLKCK